MFLPLTIVLTVTSRGAGGLSAWTSGSPGATAGSPSRFEYTPGSTDAGSTRVAAAGPARWRLAAGASALAGDRHRRHADGARAASSGTAHAASVAPVVTTSSTRTTQRPASGPLRPCGRRASRDPAAPARAERPGDVRRPPARGRDRTGRSSTAARSRRGAIGSPRASAATAGDQLRLVVAASARPLRVDGNRHERGRHRPRHAASARATASPSGRGEARLAAVFQLVERAPDDPAERRAPLELEERRRQLRRQADRNPRRPAPAARRAPAGTVADRRRPRGRSPGRRAGNARSSSATGRRGRRRPPAIIAIGTLHRGLPARSGQLEQDPVADRRAGRGDRARPGARARRAAPRTSGTRPRQAGRSRVDGQRPGARRRRRRAGRRRRRRSGSA